MADRGGRGGQGRGGRDGGQDGRGGRGGGYRGRGDGSFRGGDRGAFRGDRGSYRGGDRGSYRGGDRGSYRGGGRGNYRGGRGGRGSGSHGGGGRGRGNFRGGGGPAKLTGQQNKPYAGTVQPIPDATVEGLENGRINIDITALAKTIGKINLGRSSKSTQQSSHGELFPVRPAFGTQGNAVIVWANYFAVDVEADVYWKYTVAAVERLANGQPKEVKGRKLHLVMQKVCDHFGNEADVATEYKSQLISLQKLKIEANPFRMELPRESATEADIFEITINGPVEARMDLLANYLKSQERGPERNVFPRFPECVDALNVILGHGPRGKLDEISAVGSARFFPFGPTTSESFYRDLMDQSYRPLIAARGFFQSARISTGRLLLNTNVTCGVFKVSGPLANMFDKLGVSNVNGGDYVTRTLRTASKFLPKTRVLVKFKLADGTVVKRTKAIYSLVTSWNVPKTGDHPPKVTTLGNGFAGPNDISFWLDNDKGGGEYVTVFKYFKNKYGVSLKNYPVLNLGRADKPTFFPAEVIEILPGQSVKAKLTGAETSAMLKHACKPPSENAASLETVARQVLGLDDQTLGQFGVTVGKNLLAVHARVLNAPVIRYGGGSGNVKPLNGSWNMSKVKVFRGCSVERWAFMQISPNPERCPLIDPKYIAKFQEVAQNMGIDLAQPVQSDGPQVISTDAAARGDVLDEVFKWAQEQKLEFLLFVFAPNEDKDGAYQKIKFLGDCAYGIHTSCVVAQKFVDGPEDIAQGTEKVNAPYFTNVLLKWNLKKGGINHQLTQDIALLKEGKTMVVGYDVTHPTNMPMGKGNTPPSLVGVVASTDKDLGQWPSVVWEQASKQEMLDDRLVDAFKSRLDLWVGKAPHSEDLPENIVIFRDGVSEGQFAQVLALELPKIRKACREKYDNTQPKLTIVVSVKRHQTRFYPAMSGEQGVTGNIKCGTVIDRDVTQASYWDFYLTAHHALQGTARPAHYTVLLDEVFRANYGSAAADNLEKLTHEMCYLFGRATKAISICPPAYYADIVCERARDHRPHMFDASDEGASVASVATTSASGTISIHQNLKDSMYYI